MARQIRMTISQQGKQFRKQIITSVIALGLVITGVFVWNLYLPKASQAEDRIFLIKKGESVAEISQNLKKEGLIKSTAFFQFWALFKSKQKNLMAGAYRLSPAMSANQILDKLSKGEVIKENLTVIEGWTLRDIAQALEKSGLFQAEKLFKITGWPAVGYSSSTVFSEPLDFSEKFSFLKEKPKEISLEGWLFPDTYQIEYNQTAEQLVETMLKNFERKITPDLIEKIKKQNRTVFQVLTMASLLEKEVKSFADKQIAAGILWKRLASGWLLQVDASLNYLTGKTSLKLTKDDLSIDSPYNTYKYYGLPLGPICNPGIESIEAAVNYQKSDYWYYLTDSQGKTIFSHTLDEHNQARRKHLPIILNF